MEIKFNVTGAGRKELVNAVSEITERQAIYKGAPTFTYEVGDYIIDKHGTMKGEDNPDLVAELQGLHSFNAVSAEYDTPLPDADPVPEGIQIPYEVALGGRISPYRDFEEPPAYGIPENLTVEMPLEGFTEESIANLEKLIASKATLIKKAIGANALPVERTDTTLKFSWFAFSSNSDEVTAYTNLISALCVSAKEHKWIMAKEKPVENQKFAFRVFLLRLGFIGEEFKTARKILLKNLSGNAAFKNGAPSKGEVSADE